MAVASRAGEAGRVTAVVVVADDQDAASVAELTAFSLRVTVVLGRTYRLNPLPETAAESWRRPTNFHPSAAGSARLNSMTVD